MPGKGKDEVKKETLENEEKASHKGPEKAEKAKDSKKKARSGKDPWKVIKYPHLAEKSMNMVEFDNKLTFIVRKEATKQEIKDAVENLFDVTVIQVHTQITPKGVKKAYAKLSPDDHASEIASRLGMV